MILLELKRPIIACLRQVKIGGVRIVYSGSGDSGQIDDILYALTARGLDEAQLKAQNAERNPLLDLVEKVSVTIPVESQVHRNGEWVKQKKMESVPLRTALDSLLDTVLEEVGYSGFENNEGGQGTLDIDAKKGRFHLHHEENVIQAEEHEHDL